MRLVIPALCLAALPAVARAQPPALPGAEWVVLNHGRPAGEMSVRRAGDSVVVRYYHVDRNRGPRSESHYAVAADGRLVGGRSWALPLYDPPDTLGAPGDRFELARDSAFYEVRGGSAQRVRAEPGAVYFLRNDTPWSDAALARWLLGRPSRSAPVVPTGTVRAEVVADTTVRVTSGAQRARLVALHAPGGSPTLVWLDAKGELLASEVGWFITVRRGREDLLPALRPTEVAWRNRRGAALARRLTPPPVPAVAITNADVFDSERGIVLPRRTILVRGERIAAVGPADSVAVPAGARVIDAAGRTVVPGLWDMHGHLFLDSQESRGPQDLATGVTSVRDLASDLDVAVQHRDRAARGEILSPHAVLAGFIEGSGWWAGPSEAIAHSEAEALAWVARYDSSGYKQIKLYNLVPPDFVPAIAREAHRRGMRLSGHVPRGLSVPAAIRLGYDEINHAAFLFSTFFPDSFYVPRMRAYSGVAGAVARNFDVDGPAMTALIADLKAHGTVMDGTFALWMMAPAREDTLGPPPVTPDDSIAARHDRAYLRLARRLYDAGVTMVPGTDGGSYNDELETYARAGVPPVEVLRMATITSARVMREDADYGSVAPGKVADLVIVNGRPAVRVSDLRKVEWTMRAGRLYEPARIREALRSP